MKIELEIEQVSCRAGKGKDFFPQQFERGDNLGEMELIKTVYNCEGIEFATYFTAESDEIAEGVETTRAFLKQAFLTHLKVELKKNEVREETINQVKKVFKG